MQSLDFGAFVSVTRSQWLRGGTTIPSNWPRNRLLVALPPRATSNGSCQSLSRFTAKRGRSCWTPIARLMIFSSPTAASSRLSRFMRMAASSRPRSAMRGARASKPSSAPRTLLSGFSSKCPEAPQRCREPRSHGPCDRCRPSELSCSPMPRLPQTSSRIGGMQPRPWPQTAASTLAPYDA